MRHLRLYENFQEEEQEAFPSKEKAYHVTPDLYLERIQQEGLTPRTESKLSPHPERIYLLLNPENTFQSLARQLWQSSRYKDQVQNYYVLEIDLTQLPDHKFYLDPESLLTYIGIYTYESIPPAAIRVLETLPVASLSSETISD